MEILGLNKLREQLKDKVKTLAGSEPVVVVGYTAAYAIYVHENLEAHHPVGQAKFLEQPARQLTGDGTLRTVLNRVLSAGKTMAQALMAVGLTLQQASQRLCPVLTGNLKNSAFTRMEKS